MDSTDSASSTVRFPRIHRGPRHSIGSGGSREEGPQSPATCDPAANVSRPERCDCRLSRAGRPPAITPLGGSVPKVSSSANLTWCASSSCRIACSSFARPACPSWSAESAGQSQTHISRAGTMPDRSARLPECCPGEGNRPSGSEALAFPLRLRPRRMIGRGPVANRALSTDGTVIRRILGAPVPQLRTFENFETNKWRLLRTGRFVSVRSRLNWMYLQAVSGRLRSEEHTSELQSLRHLVCRLLLEEKK